MDKPQEFTSFDVVAKLRGILRIKKIGHTGTLDPMATGVLPVLLGSATKACDLLPNQDKRYQVSLQFGLTSDTQDIWGTVTTRQEKSLVTRPALEQALTAFRGEILQLPPMYSAVSVGGQRLYDLARKGMEVERAPRPVTIYELALCAFDEKTQTAQLNVSCSKGTYIRTICHDLGTALGCGAVMTALRRTEAAGFSLGECHSFEEVVQLMAENRLSEAIQPVERLFADYPILSLSAAQQKMFCNGVRLDLDRIRDAKAAGPHRIHGQDGSFLGLANADWNSRELRLIKFF